MKRTITSLTFLLFFTLCVIHTIHAQQEILPDSTIKVYHQTSQQLQTLLELKQRQVLDDIQYHVQVEFYKKQFLKKTAIAYDTVKESQLLQLDWWGKVKGVLTLANVLWFIGAVLVVVGIAMLFGSYFEKVMKRVHALLMEIPEGVYEVFFYGLCVFAIGLGSQFDVGTDQFVALLGCLGMIGALSFSLGIRGSFVEKYSKAIGFWVCTILFFLWAGVAYYYQSELLGFMSIMALEGMLGFTFIAFPFLYILGWDDEKLIPVAVVVSFGLVVVFVVSEVGGLTWSWMDIYRSGIYFMGTFVYFIGLLIICSDYYTKNKKTYRRLQFLFILSSIGALYIGFVFNIPKLKDLSGTFLGLWILEKYFEVPWKKIGYQWAVFLMGGLLYALGWAMHEYPTYFLFIE